MQHRRDCMKTLPLLEGAKVIVIDEGLEALYARTLIAGWMRTWLEKDHNYSVDLLSFSDPKFWYNDEPKSFVSKNVQLHDYYSIDVDKVANEDIENLRHILETVNPHNTVIIDCLSSLVLYVGLTKTLWFIEKLSKHVSQLICIYRRDFIQNKIPAIETLGTTYVKLEKHVGISAINSLVYSTTFVHRKPGGSVLCQTEVITQDNATYQITTGSIVTPSDHKDQAGTNQPVKIESSFRIEMNAREMEQRNKTPLPYTINAANTSRIHYQPDDVDDIDEDDPDDDLCI
ncbi:PREDICTED: uncharacterized protein LOC106747779 [Dinoponera quadriceps]|uniref:Elongator complex protein 5 n=1 Tax=Dinoponera quadriceps TaxID=609295 RepID=A0A6P3XRZ7_DINQU|nr:PREDICTED: uncharacterized protein LOC106747779 [Dinoponera quadriceps]